MNKRSMKFVALIGLAVLAIASWEIATAGSGRSKSPDLSKAAVASIHRSFPKAKIVKIKAEPQVVMIYEVELRQGGKELEAEVFLNGEILSVGSEIARNDLPKAVADTLAKLAKGASIKEIEKKEIRATISISRFAKPKNTYEAEFVKDGKTVEVKIDASGKVLSTKIEADDDDDDDDGEDEQEISLDDVPKAVRRTILQHAGKNKVLEVEVETRNGKKTYEAEWKDNGNQVEIKVAPDGKVLNKQVGQDDDEDED